MDVRPAAISDAPALMQLNAEFNGEGLGTAEHIAQSLAEDREIVCIAFLDGEPAGFCCAQVTSSMCYMNKCGEITELYVRENTRRKGVATGLMRLAESLCIERGAKEIKLLTGDDNFAAQALYESLGYEQDGEVHYAKDVISC